MTAETIGILCANLGSFDSPWIGDSDTLMEQSGHNIGNFAFWYAVDKLVAGNKVRLPFGCKAEDYAGKIDRFIIPAANFLSSEIHFGWLADFIEALDVPCAILGLGAQSETDQSMPALSEGTLRFLRAVAARTPFLGVRGEYTKSVCEHYGVKNVEVLGCPSLLISANRRLGEVVEAKWAARQRRVAVHAAYIKGNTRNVERRLFEFMDIYPGSAYILQRPVEFLKLLFNETLNESDVEQLKMAAPFLAPDLSYEQFLAKLGQYSHVPYSVESWIAYLRHFSHAVGTRIHGTLLSLAAEVPAVCVHHDTRTVELCDTMMVPSIGVYEFRTDRNTIRELFAHVKMDGKAFDANRARLAGRNRALLAEAGFPVSEHLLHLAAA